MLTFSRKYYQLLIIGVFLLLVLFFFATPVYASDIRVTIDDEAVIFDGQGPIPINPRPPMVALTFDDGPSPNTSRILDVLERYDARATFFVLGYRSARHRNIVERAANIGSEIASHTWTHDNMAHLSAARIRESIESTSALIESITGVPSPHFFRPPFGSTNDTVRYVSAQMGYTITNWTLDTWDWRNRNPDIIYEAIMNEVEDGSVILLHDIHLTTAQAMEFVIPSLIAQGFELVTLSELLMFFYGELVPGKIYGRVYDEDLEARESLYSMGVYNDI